MAECKEKDFTPIDYLSEKQQVYLRKIRYAILHATSVREVKRYEIMLDKLMAIAIRRYLQERKEADKMTEPKKRAGRDIKINVTDDISHTGLTEEEYKLMEKHYAPDLSEEEEGFFDKSKLKTYGRITLKNEISVLKKVIATYDKTLNKYPESEAKKRMDTVTEEIKAYLRAAEKELEERD